MTTVYGKLNNLLTAANAKTGESDTTLTDAVQTLIDGYGGGGSAVLELLEEITLSEAVHAYDIDFSQYISGGYNTIYGYVDLALSSTDYIYYGVKRSGQNNVYISSWVGQRATEAAWRFSWGKMADGTNYSVANSGATLVPNINVFRVWAYSGGVNITAGSKIRLYGVKYTI